MKRLLTSIFAGVIVFGLVAAFAATLSVDAGGLGAGQATVGNCDDNESVDLEYTTAFTTEYEVTEVVVSDIDNTNCSTISVRVGTESFDNVGVTGPSMAFDISDTPAETFEPDVHVALSS